MLDRAVGFFARVARVKRAAIRKRREEAHDAGNARLVGPAAVLAGQRSRARRRAVKRAVGGQHFVPARAALRANFIASSFASPPPVVKKTRPPSRHGAMLDDRARELGALVVAEARRDVGQPARLFGDRVGDGRVAVAEIDGDQPGREIEIALAAIVVEVRILRRGRSTGGLRPPCATHGVST